MVSRAIQCPIHAVRCFVEGMKELGYSKLEYTERVYSWESTSVSSQTVGAGWQLELLSTQSSPQNISWERPSTRW